VSGDELPVKPVAAECCVISCDLVVFTDEVADPVPGDGSCWSSPVGLGHVFPGSEVSLRSTRRCTPARPVAAGPREQARQGHVSGDATVADKLPGSHVLYCQARVPRPRLPFATPL
jgi:hypothetical protein